jgi:hypothetical protein
MSEIRLYSSHGTVNSLANIVSMPFGGAAIEMDEIYGAKVNEHMTRMEGFSSLGPSAFACRC